MTEESRLSPSEVAHAVKRRLDLTDAVELDRSERQAVANRLAQGAPAGIFDLSPLCAIHAQLFQDTYSWTGQLRTLEIATDINFSFVASSKPAWTTSTGVSKNPLPARIEPGAPIPPAAA